MNDGGDAFVGRLRFAWITAEPSARRAAVRDWLPWLTVLMLTAGPAPAADTVALSGQAMGTTWVVKFVPPSIPIDRDVVARRVAARLEELERQFSTYRPDSEVSVFNRSTSTNWQAVSPELAQVANASRRISELTGGAFDVTVEPLVRLWGFGAVRRETLPGALEIAAARARVGWRDLEVRLAPPALRKSRPDLAADFSSMAKGFASDAIVELLGELWLANAFVQVGGDIRTSGHNADGVWRAGIEEPGEGTRPIACVVELAGRALSTSGDYRNAFVAGGRRYGHIIDPRTGYPAGIRAAVEGEPRRQAEGRLAAVSVVHAACADSSAWATALFVLGPDEGWRVARRERVAGVFFIRDADGLARRMTPEFERLLR